MKDETNNFSKNPAFIKKMFNSISFDYDKLNDIMSLGLHKRIKEDVINQTKFHLSSTSDNLIFLDLCTGTGDLTGILKKEYPQSRIIGIDFSDNMLQIARKKYPQIEFIEADCTNLSFEDNSVNLCIISFGLRNIEDMEKVLKEIYRILKPGGVFINLDLGKPNKFFNIFLKPYMYLWVTILGKIFHGNSTPYKYLAVSNETFPAPDELIKIYKKIGFQNIKNKNYLFGQIASQISKKVTKC